MHYRRSKKIFLYFFLFLIIGTFNNKNLNNFDFPRIKEINITGLDDKEIYELKEKLNFLMANNLFSLNKIKVEEIINSNNLVEYYSVIKKYPSSLRIVIKKTKFLAYVKQNEKTFLLGSNGKLIDIQEMSQNLPMIFGNFENNNFFRIKKMIDKIDFDYKDIKNLFFFKSGRVDIETISGVVIKLPINQFEESFKLVIKILNDDQFKNVKEIDLRQKNQVVLSE
tara:strand:- start:1624 stop:2295 length:672 start_codon:yes stop_codon:yes gene_type:complete